jgi:hypothetical protein
MSVWKYIVRGGNRVSLSRSMNNMYALNVRMAVCMSRKKGKHGCLVSVLDEVVAQALRHLGAVSGLDTLAIDSNNDGLA